MLEERACAQLRLRRTEGGPRRRVRVLEAVKQDGRALEYALKDLRDGLEAYVQDELTVHGDLSVRRHVSPAC